MLFATIAVIHNISLTDVKKYFFRRISTWRRGKNTHDQSNGRQSFLFIYKTSETHTITEHQDQAPPSLDEAITQKSIQQLQEEEKKKWNLVLKMTEECSK